MPILATKSAKVYQSKNQRRGRVFCDGCGKVIKDDYYWSWIAVNIDENSDWKERHANSHINMTCSGGTVLDLFALFPYWGQLPAELPQVEIVEQGKLC